MNDAATLEVRDLGLMPYAEALALQSDLVALRRAGDIPDQLLLLQHPHVITLGTGSSRSHVLADESRRRDLGIDLIEVGRGARPHVENQQDAWPFATSAIDKKTFEQFSRLRPQLSTI